MKKSSRGPADNIQECIEYGEYDELFDELVMQCIVCGSEKTFHEDGVWKCHDCGSADVGEVHIDAPT
ncbi:hypothetical protein [Paenibacillus elgii]|uniref:hypothetical protein n=1 Tax=Paenibacillus elgii TaxID=189691 RepID=UPI00203A69A2|nr:hypothetical protein [Paenibacillus elgii]MCM3273679.1 hypothetical protein [Paenibacillus elgii]